MVLARNLVIALSGLVCLTDALVNSRDGAHCPPFNNGSFIIHQYQLYPENAAWDYENCLVYFSALFNGTFAVFDPYRNEIQEIVSFPRISDDPNEHASGIHWDPRTGFVYLVIDAQNAFLTNGADVSGDYWLIKYDPLVKQEAWRANLTSITQSKWGGFQDVTVDAQGNAFVIGTYPSSIIRVDCTGTQFDVWYPPQTTNTSVHGFTGVASVGDTLLVVDAENVPEQSTTGASEIYRFDMREEKGVPVFVRRTPHEPLGVPDAIHLPPEYGGTVMLVAMDLIGVQVLRSNDGWLTAEDLGTIESDFPELNQAGIPSTVQVGQSQFIIGIYFPGTIVPGTKAGNRTEFPLFDITAQVEALLT